MNFSRGALIRFVKCPPPKQLENFFLYENTFLFYPMSLKDLFFGVDAQIHVQLKLIRTQLPPLPPPPKTPGK